MWVEIEWANINDKGHAHSECSPMDLGVLFLY